MVSNIHGLPKPLADALTPNRRKPIPGRFGVTALIDSPLRRLLTMRHFDQIEEDVSEGIWALLGTMGHRVLEQNKQVSEIRFEQDLFGAKIVGIADYSADGVVIDFKFTSVWAAVFASEKSEWANQLQIYGHLVQLSGRPVTSLENWLILRDWNVRERQRSSGDYPEIPFKQIVYKPWSKEAVAAFIQERMSLHLEAEKYALQSDLGEIPANLFCTSTERWEKPTKYAVKKKGQERAVKLFDILDDATNHAAMNKDWYVEIRPGENVRCLSYCSVNKWCPYYKNNLTI